MGMLLRRHIRPVEAQPAEAAPVKEPAKTEKVAKNGSKRGKDKDVNQPAAK